MINIPDAAVEAGVLALTDLFNGAKPNDKADVVRVLLTAALPHLTGDHSDDKSVQSFASMMKEKLRHSREIKKRDGWEECDLKYLSEMLHELVAKGDPVDVANLCMMISLAHPNDKILPAFHLTGWREIESAPEDGKQEPFGLSADEIETLRTNSLKPEEIAGDEKAQALRVRELLHWFVRLSRNSANPKWTRSHAFELAYYIATTDDRALFDIGAIEREAWRSGLQEPESVREMAVRHGWTPAPEAKP